MKADSSLTRVTSWIIVSKATGQPVLETFSERIVAAINLDRYRVLSSLEWLQEFNEAVSTRRKTK